jgi:glycerol-3-phosphate dehydrogenase
LTKTPESFGFSPETRRQNLHRLKNEEFDVLILGGGINGAGVARDLTLRAQRAGRPLRVALVEQRHFASGTSGKNSQLLHGGLRYLKQLEFRLVRQALRERTTLLEMAPHLVQPLPFLIPMYGWFPRVFYGTGLWLYDFLAGDKNIARRRLLSRREVSEIEPGLSADELTAGAIFFDCLVHSARFVLENIFDAARQGAVIANYVRAERTQVTDVLSGESFPVRARKLVDATGPWESGDGLRLVRGSHIILPRVNASENAIAYFEQTGRIIFVIPWGNSRQLSLVGTTDIDHEGGPDDVRISADEIRYLLRIVRELFPSAAEVQPIAAYSSLRPLLRGADESPTQTSREHRIWNSEDGVLHMAGGKYTTYRVMSEEAADLVAQEISPELSGCHVTAQTPLGGNHKSCIETLLTQAAQLAAQYGLETEEVKSLIREYGVLSPAVLAYLPASAGPGLSRLQRARIAFAAQHEMAQRLPDLMFVSTYWGYEQRWTADTLAPFAEEMGRQLGWDWRRVEEEVELTLRIAAMGLC